MSIHNLSTGEREICKLATIASRFFGTSRLSSGKNRVMSQECLALAQKRLGLLKPFLDPAHRTRSAIKKVANELNKHHSTIYRWLKKYDETQSASVFVAETPSGGRGKKRLALPVERKMLEILKSEVKRRPRPEWDELVKIVRGTIRAMGFFPPHENTIRDRWQHEVGEAKQAGKRTWPDHYDPGPCVWQIDHLRVNTMVADEEFRFYLERPWITIAVDVFSRAIPGFAISDTPDADSVGLCLARCILPKHDWLKELGVPGEWPIHGLPMTIHADNAKVFRGNMLKQVCLDYGMDLQWRKVMTPQYGGHIERYAGTLSKFFNSLPGTTGRAPDCNGDYDSADEACLTLNELEALVADEIVNHYHLSKHGGIGGLAPIEKYRRCILGTDDQPGTGLPFVPLDERKLRIELSPIFYRTIQKTGVEIDNIQYYDPILDPFIQTAKKGIKYKFHRFNGFIAPIYFWNPNDEFYYEIPYRNLEHDIINIHNLREARSEVIKAQEELNEARIFEYYCRKRAREDEAKEKSRMARLAISKRPENLSGRLNVPVPAVPKMPILPDPQEVEGECEPFEHLEEL
jgi:putative transposase